MRVIRVEVKSTTALTARRAHQRVVERFLSETRMSREESIMMV